MYFFQGGMPDLSKLNLGGDGGEPTEEELEKLLGGLANNPELDEFLNTMTKQLLSKNVLSQPMSDLKKRVTDLTYYWILLPIFSTFSTCEEVKRRSVSFLLLWLKKGIYIFKYIYLPEIDVYEDFFFK